MADSSGRGDLAGVPMSYFTNYVDLAAAVLARSRDDWRHYGHLSAKRVCKLARGNAKADAAEYCRLLLLWGFTTPRADLRSFFDRAGIDINDVAYDTRRNPWE